MSNFSVLCRRGKKEDILFSPIRGNFMIAAETKTTCSTWFLSIRDKVFYDIQPLSKISGSQQEYLTLGYQENAIHSFYIELNSIHDITPLNVQLTIHDLTCVPFLSNAQSQLD